jgi:hypothetical protein
MASKPGLPGSHLLAALHAGMERMKSVLKVCRAASKKPQNRCVVAGGPVLSADAHAAVKAPSRFPS